MKVTFYVDSRANIKSCRSVTWNLDDPKDVRSFGYTKEEWLSLSEDEKDEIIQEWANETIDLYYEEG